MGSKVQCQSRMKPKLDRSFLRADAFLNFEWNIEFSRRNRFICGTDDFGSDICSRTEQELCYWNVLWRRNKC